MSKQRIVNPLELMKIAEFEQWFQISLKRDINVTGIQLL
jgi:hypothetical protein